MFGYENSSSSRVDMLGKTKQALVQMGIESVSKINESGYPSSVTIHYSTGDSKTFRGDEAERKMNAILGECARIERSMKIEKILKNGT